RDQQEHGQSVLLGAPDVAHGDAGPGQAGPDVRRGRQGPRPAQRRVASGRRDALAPAGVRPDGRTSRAALRAEAPALTRACAYRQPRTRLDDWTWTNPLGGYAHSVTGLAAIISSQSLRGPRSRSVASRT